METTRRFELIEHSEYMEGLFSKYCQDIDNSILAPYIGHVYRVLNYAMYFINYDDLYQKEIETALVFHDLAACKMETMQYLEPSYEYLLTENRFHEWGLNGDLMKLIIEFHHKIFAYQGDYSNIVNAVRCGDWIEVSFGHLNMGMPRDIIKEVSLAFPTGNFVSLIAKIGPQVSGGRVNLIKDMLRVIKV